MPAGVAQITPSANSTPVARTDGTIDPGWLPDAQRMRSIALWMESAKSLTGSPALDTSETNKRYLFDDTAVEEVTWQFIMPSNYSSAPRVKLVYSMASATSGAVMIDAAVMAVTPGDAADVNTPSFDTTNSQTVTVPATAGYVDSIEIPLTTNDSVASGDFVKIRLTRQSTNVADTSTGDFELLGIIFEYQAAD